MQFLQNSDGTGNGQTDGASVENIGAGLRFNARDRIVVNLSRPGFNRYVMKIEIKLFAVAKQLVGAEVVPVELPDSATIGQLRSALAQQYPPLEKIAPQLMFAINADYAGDSTLIPAEAEIACIPPVSGG